jgi:hypothetical protein
VYVKELLSLPTYSKPSTFSCAVILRSSITAERELTLTQNKILNREGRIEKDDDDGDDEVDEV